MSKEITVLPVGFDALCRRAKSALESFQGSPIKKEGKVASFLVDLLGYKNQHVMAADQSTPRMVSFKVEMKSIVVIETDGDNGSVISTYTSNALSMKEHERQVKSVFASEMGDHNDVLSELVEMAGIDEHDHEVVECLLSWNVERLVEMAYEEQGLGLLYEVLPQITCGRVSATVINEWLEVEESLDKVTIR